jgi:hypothetical protein
MAFPTATTCTKCGKLATMNRRDALVLRTVEVQSLKLESTKIGYSYSVTCPYCGFHFTSRPENSSHSQ